MNDSNMVSMFLFSALEVQVMRGQLALVVGELSVYERCGMGAYEVAYNLSSVADELLDKYNPEHPFTDLLYTDCDIIAALLYDFMHEHEFMPTSIYALELSECQTLK